MSDSMIMDDESLGADSGNSFHEMMPISSQGSVSTISTQENRDSQRKKGFRKFKELAEVFDRESWTDNRQGKVTCKFCSSTITSNRMERCFDHIAMCSEIAPDIRERFIAIKSGFVKTNRSTDDSKRDLLLTAMIIENNLPLRIVESESFKSFMKSFNVRYVPPNRHDISERIIPKIASGIDRTFLAGVNQSEDFSLSIEFDHWQDLTHRSILGIIATKPDGSRYLLDLEEVSIKGHSSEAIRDSLTTCLSGIPSIKINSIISDSASTCKKARQMLSLSLDYSHLIDHRCIAHLLNLIGERFATSKPLKNLIESATSLTTFLSNDTLFLAKMKASGYLRIKTPCKTRWYSTVDMLESLESMEKPALDYLKERIKSRRDKDKVDSMMNILNNRQFQEDLKLAIKFFRPLANCIAVAEKADSSLGEAVREMLEYAKIICTSDARSKFALAAIESFFGFFSEDYLGELEFGIMIASYFLDRRFKMDYITEDGIAIVLKTAAKLAGLTGYTNEDILKIMYQEFSQFCQQRGNLSKIAVHDCKARVWWREQPNIQGTLPILKTVAIRLANLRSSSANIERLFSVIKLTQGLNRTNYSTKTLTSIARSKLSMLQDDFDIEIYDLINERRGPDGESDENRRDPKRRKNTSQPRKKLRAVRTSTEEGQVFPGTPAIPGFRAIEVFQANSETRENSRDGDESNVDDGSRQKSRIDKALASYNKFKQLIDFTIITNLREEVQRNIDRSNLSLDLEELERRFREDDELFVSLSQDRNSSGNCDYSTSSTSLTEISGDISSLNISIERPAGRRAVRSEISASMSRIESNQSKTGTSGSSST